VDKPQPGDEIAVRIDRLAYGGEAVGRHHGFVLLVEGALPGEAVRVRIRRVCRQHAEADLVGVDEPSPQRISPRCPHVAQGCGGCTFQHLAYEGQLATKQSAVHDCLERIGGFRDPPMRPIIPSPSAWYYRNKMELAFHPTAGLGLHVRGSWHEVFTLETCFLQSPLSVEIVKAARVFAREHALPLWDPIARRGLLRDLVVRNSNDTGEVLVGVVTAPGPFPAAPALAARLTALDARVVGVVHARRADVSDASPIESTTVLAGRGTLTETLAGLRFQLGLETFFQTNTAQAERLVALVRELAGPIAGATVVDVYCGVGIFTLALAAGGAAHVCGIEIVPASIEAARANASGNALGNTSFMVGDARHALPEALADHGPPAVIVLDPPRSGAGGKVMRRIARAQPARIVYVSCNPATLARDLRELEPFGYRLIAVQPVDLFPQTYHVEAVAALERG